jgi:membrane associated rhomboid family serine protease
MAPGMANDQRERKGPGRGALGERVVAAPVTVGLIGLCVVAFVASLGVCAYRANHPGAVLVGSWLQLEGCGETLAGMGALRLADVWLDGSWWRVITAGILHGSWLHLALNGWSTWVVGEWVEGTWGHARTALLFVVSSTVGCLASAAWVEAPMVVGASAGVMGMAGALLVGRLVGRGEVRTRLRPLSAGVLGVSLALMVALGFVVEVIAQAGHLGGLVAGVLVGLAWSGRGLVAKVAGGLGLAGVVAGVALAAREPEGRPRYHEILGYGALERGMDAEAAAAFERALARRPDDAELANAVAYALANAGKELVRAEALVRRALEAEPENADYRDTLGWILCRRGDVEAGMVELRRASEGSGGAVEEIEGHLVECAEARLE